MPGKLWENTRELHHACEEHEVGAAMASGKPPMHWYAAWLKALSAIHCAVDPHMPECAKRVEEIEKDICETGKIGIQVYTPESAIKYAKSLTDDLDIDGAAYVLTGAHLMGGEIMRRRLDGYPTNHLLWNDRKETLNYLLTLRDREELTRSAEKCFEALLETMNDIKQMEM